MERKSELQDPQFFVKSFYKDAKGRVSVIVNIRRYWDKQHYVELFIMPDNKIQVVTYDEMADMVKDGLLAEYEPRVFETDAVWRQRAMDEERYKTMKLVKKL